MAYKFLAGAVVRGHLEGPFAGEQFCGGFNAVSTVRRVEMDAAEIFAAEGRVGGLPQLFEVVFPEGVDLLGVGLGDGKVGDAYGGEEEQYLFHG